MIATLTVGKGNHYQIGCTAGAGAAPFVRANVAAFWRALEAAGHAREWISGKAVEEMGLLAPQVVSHNN